MNVELLIADPSGSKAYLPIVEEGIEWTTERRSTPGKLTFKVVKDSIINFQEGAAVRLKVDGKGIFFGFVFSKKRDKDQIISVTAYDQLRYLNNKDTYVYENKTAAQFIKMIAADFSLNVGTIEDTPFVIASRVEDNTSLFDMIENALDLELQNNGNMFILYDDFGKLTLKFLGNMYVGDNSSGYLMIDEETGENFSYESSIDEQTYNKIKLAYNDEKTGKRELFIAQDGAKMNQWGVLQYFEEVQTKTGASVKADALLKLYDQKTRKLTIQNAFGDVRVRAGSAVVVALNLGDIVTNNYMVVNKVTHTFRGDEHMMELDLIGGEFIA